MSGVNGFTAFPRFGRPRLLLARSKQGEQALSMFRVSRPGAAIIARLMSQFRPLVIRLLGRSAGPGDMADIDIPALRRVLRELGTEASEPAGIYLAPPGPNRKWTAQIIEGDRITGYCKFATQPRPVDLIEHEQRVLDDLGRRENGWQGSVPVVLGHRQEAGAYYLVISTAPGAEPRAGTNFLPADLDWLGRVAAATARPVSFQQFDELHGLSGDLRSLPQSLVGVNVQAVALECYRQSASHFADRSLLVAFGHGDYASWNTLVKPDGGLFVFDWEYGSPDWPALFDIVHFFRTRNEFVDGFGSGYNLQRLCGRHEDDAGTIADLAVRMGIPVADVPVYVGLYLLLVLIRHASQLHHATEGQGQAQKVAYLARAIDSCNALMRSGRIRRRVLVSAYACEADKGSEPGVGWNWVREIVADSEIVVLTKGNNRESIDRYLEANPTAAMSFRYLEVPKWLSFWKSKQRGVRLYYYLWQWFALPEALRANRMHRFDLGHHVTFVNDWLWSFLALVPLPFIWGPIGSHPPYPAQLEKSRRTAVLEFARLSIQRGARLLDPMFWLTAMRASRVIAINHEVARQRPLRWLVSDKLVIEPAIAIDTVPDRSGRDDRQKFRILFVGRFHYVKNPLLALEAFRQFREHCPESELIMLGRGPEESRLKAYIERFGLGDAVTLLPWRPHAEVIELMSSADVFLFPSVEGGGMVILEAMALGLPVVCLDYGGPGAMVSPESGIAVPLGPQPAVVEGLAGALTRLAGDEEYRKLLGEGGVARARNQYSWRAKGKLSASLYEQVVDERRRTN